MGSLLKYAGITLFLISILISCAQPEDKFIGTWEYDGYKVKDEGVGSLQNLIPGDWKEKVNNWIEKGEGLANSTITFKPDGTYEEEIKNGPNKVLVIKGQYSVMKDLSQLNLKTNEDEYAMPIEVLTDTSFTYRKEYGKLDVPFTVEITYKRKK
tara:strand:+ start:16364 stop:16825 length:462 start_codon:yes stop_codon:yes gene_type:complete